MARSTAVRIGVVAASTALVLALAACAPSSSDPKGPEEGSSGKPIAAAAWSPDADCMSCHVSEAESMGDATTLYSLHGKHSTMSACIDCHGEDGAALAKAHENYMGEKARIPSKLKKTDVTDAVCTTSGCHEMGELVGLTADAPLVDGEGTRVNPHSMVGDPLHGVGGDTGSNLTCVTCHEMHAAGSAEGSFAREAANARCIGCHHADVYECNTCHE